MSINIELDKLFPVAPLIEQRIGKRPAPATIWRWRLKGINGVRLECVLCGGCWMTTAAAFAEFVRAQTANVQPALLDAPAPTERSDAKKIPARQ